MIFGSGFHGTPSLFSGLPRVRYGGCWTQMLIIRRPLACLGQKTCPNTTIPQCQKAVIATFQVSRYCFLALLHGILVRCDLETSVTGSTQSRQQCSENPKAVSAHFTSTQILPFGFAPQPAVFWHGVGALQLIDWQANPNFPRPAQLIAPLAYLTDLQHLRREWRVYSDPGTRGGGGGGGCHPCLHQLSSSMQRQTAVTAYLKSKQLLPFVSTRRSCVIGRREDKPP